MVGWVDDSRSLLISFCDALVWDCGSLLPGAVEGGGITRRTELCGVDTLDSGL
jgi:hypothetical protein